MNDLRILPPTVDLESKPVLKQCLAARAALAELRLAVRLLSEPAVLKPLLRLEATHSFAIDGMAVGPTSPQAGAYEHALNHGFATLAEAPLSICLAATLCRLLSTAGRDCGLALSASASREPAALYLSPHQRALLDNWERFLAEPGELDPVVRMAVQHYQLQAIHAFGDASGRTGRVVSVLCLIQDKVLDFPSLNLSRFLLANRDSYARLFSRVAAGEWEPWLLYMLEATTAASAWSSRKIHAIRALMAATAAHIRAQAPRLYSRQLVELIFIEPYCRIGNLVASGIAERHGASTLLKELVRLDVLVEERRWRDKIFLNRTYLDLICSDDSAAPPSPGLVVCAASVSRVPSP